MGAFRRFIIAMAEAFQVISIFASVIGFGFLGRFIVSWINFNPLARIALAGTNIGSTSEVLGFVLGALVGFIVAGTAAAILFTFSEIAANTRALVLQKKASLPLSSEKLEPRILRST